MSISFDFLLHLPLQQLDHMIVRDSTKYFELLHITDMALFKLSKRYCLYNTWFVQFQYQKLKTKYMYLN